MWSLIKRVLFVVGFVFTISVVYKLVFGAPEADRMVSKNEILHLEIKGIIMDGKKFLEALKKYSKEESVKAIVIDINSPGGAVGPSQEIYYEILRAKKDTKKKTFSSKQKKKERINFTSIITTIHLQIKPLNLALPMMGTLHKRVSLIMI